MPLIRSICKSQIHRDKKQKGGYRGCRKGAGELVPHGEGSGFARWENPGDQ